ncbi:MAG: TetR/AcrR family transcriptional regulator [Pseudomonadota bacterium]
MKSTRDTAERQRLPPHERQLLIVEGAVSYFAEVGFEGQVRELARRLGITNALLFKYFPTKQDLIDRVYQQVYLGRWREEWDDLLKDRTHTLETRLRRFYKSYLSVIFTYEWVRIFFFAGLRGVNINERYLQLLATRVVHVICDEVRHEAALPEASEVPLSDVERDTVWGLQGQILYISVRRFIYNQTIADPEAIVDAAVDVFMSGMAALARAGVACAPPRGSVLSPVGFSHFS